MTINRYNGVAQDKLRGGYYTSPNVADWLCTWAIRTQEDQLLEPSCGDGSFLDSAIRRFTELGCRGPEIAKNLTGIEIIASEADTARKKLDGALGLHAPDIIVTTDFFDWWQKNTHLTFDAIVGNPPFIRYQTFPEPNRSRAMKIMSDLGLKPNRLTNIWVPFVLASASSLRPNGRLALVLPAELLQVSYAAQLRSFLADRFSRIDIVTCNELFFENAEQEVVLLLADGALEAPSESNPCRVTLTEKHTLAEIIEQQPSTVLAAAQPKIIRHDNEKWLKYFLTEREISFMRALRLADNVTALKTHATVDVGVVTGKNEFFILTNNQVVELGLDGYTVPVLSRSAHLRGAKVSMEDWETMSSGDARVQLLNLGPIKNSELPVSIASYIQYGEEKAFHKGYKCSIRTPWYAVPSVWIPNAFLFRQIYDFPRMILNQAGATSTDTIHRVTCNTEAPEQVVAHTYTWLTAASAEIEGRSYGGGVLELEPTEAERLLMPTRLTEALPLVECDRLIRAGRLNDVLEENARVILILQMGLSQNECNLLRTIWEKMRNRRLARGRNHHKPRDKEE